MPEIQLWSAARIVSWIKSHTDKGHQILSDGTLENGEFICSCGSHLKIRLIKREDN
jgi:hypothetical protein